MNNDIITELLMCEDLGSKRLLTFDEEQAIFKLLKNDSNLREDVQTIMIKANIKLVYSIAKKYYPVSTLSNDDIVQLGMIGLSKAVDHFDYQKGIKFSSYASYWIKQSISKGIHKALCNIEQPTNATELKKQFFETEEKMVSLLKRNVSFEEVATKMGVKASELRMLFDISNVASLDKILDFDKETSGIEIIKDDDDTPQEAVLNDEKNELIILALNSLSPREGQIIKYRYGYDDGVFHSFSEVANKFSISRQRAQIIEKVAINKMKELFESFGNTVCIISKDDKIKYHGAAAIASNLVVGLIGLSEELLKQCGFDEKSAHNALAPIIKGNVKHIVEEGVVEALTGPIERCDVSTVRKHMSVFDKKTNEIYKAVSKEVLEIAKIKNKDRDYSKMEEVLQ